MAHPLVEQLRFARSEFQRSLVGVTDEEARKRFMPINTISWMIGHLASQEQHYWLNMPQGKIAAPRLYELTAHGIPATTPSLNDMWSDWTEVTGMADHYLDRLSTEMMQEYLIWNGTARQENIGTMLLRTTYHYWFHNGEAQAVRQLLGHTALPEFVGNIGDEAPYRVTE